VPTAPAEIRAADFGDAAAITAIYAPYVLDSVVSFEELSPHADEMARRMVESPRLPWFVATRAGVVAGYAYAGHHKARAAYRWAVDVSVYLAAAEHRQGTGRRLYEALLDELAALGYVNAYAGITLPNPASVGLHQSMGFTPVGVYTGVGFKHGRWHDVGWWQRPLCDAPQEPREPAPWSPTRRR
jgi:phosphinothricin acetyltransferase